MRRLVLFTLFSGALLVAAGVGLAQASGAGAAPLAVSQAALAQAVARWVAYLAAGMLAGGTLFVLLVWAPTQTAAGPLRAGPEAAPWHALAGGAVGALLAASSAELLLHAGQTAGGEWAWPWDLTTGRVLFHSAYGALWLARLALALALAGLLLGHRTQRELWLAAVAAAALLLTFSLGSHAAGEAAPGLPVAADWLHMLAASVWWGGLTHLAAGVSWVAVAGLSGHAPVPPAELAARVVRRFALLALASTAALALSGLYLGLLRVGSAAALTSSTYGQVLLAKVAGALILAAIGASSHAWYPLRLEGAARWARLSTPEIVDRLRYTVAGQVLLGMALLFGAGLLAGLPSPRPPAAAATQAAEARAGDLSLALTIMPGRAGFNTFLLRLTAGGRPVEDAAHAMLRFAPAAGEAAASQAHLDPIGGGVYRAQGTNLSEAGAWQVQAVVQGHHGPERVADFSVTVAAAGGAAPPAWSRVTGGFLLACALLFVFAAARLPLLGGRATAPGGLLPALALFAAGAALFYRPTLGSPAALPNPIAREAASIAAGQALYAGHCLACHGPEGRGDGPVGVTLSPPPADLSLHARPGMHPDGQLYAWITDGFPGSVMPAFGTVLSDEQRWHLVNYIRTLAEE